MGYYSHNHYRWVKLRKLAQIPILAQKKMQRPFLFIISLGILILSSCSSSPPVPGGYWIYAGHNYFAITAVGYPGPATLMATTAATDIRDTAIFRFSSYPPPAGTYTVIDSATPAQGQVFVSMMIGNKIYRPTGNSPATATVTANGNSINLIISAIHIANLANATDSGVFTAAILQTQ